MARRVHRDGFLEGYFQKEATTGSTLLGLSTLGGGLGLGAAGKLQSLMVILPILAGTTAGTLHSKLTSPTGADTENLQKKIINSELEETLSYLKRKRQKALESEEEESGGKNVREIRL